ncbi:BQ2448_4958 [Microbotryum intermedium]|uniref:BQ2448_4958 protein n=1 Tax=Microbotryum intermedium TaxID=269621 RepID=A0A238FK49_9BASI|nr:BQ2448_4958 [Microbotryum intermedium]
MLAATDAGRTRCQSGSAMIATSGRLTLLLLGLATIMSVSVADAAAISNAATTNYTTNTTNTTNATTTDQDLGFYNVIPGGGRWLTYAVEDTLLGEPINVVISADSDPFIMTEAGLDDWFLSIQYGAEFLNVSLGGKQKADLGDGNGRHNQTQILRYNYFDTIYGTLQESVNGGSHVRIWQQNGLMADSGAWFVAASVEYPAAMGHLIVPNGYDLGRDEVVGNATMRNGTISPATNRTFSATSQLIQFLPANSSANINHDIKTDGNVAILTVKVTSNGSASTSSANESTAPSSTFMTLQAKTLVIASTVLSVAIASLL